MLTRGTGAKLGELFADIALKSKICYIGFELILQRKKMSLRCINKNGADKGNVQ